RARAQGAAGKEHPDRRQQPARSCVDETRSRRRAAHGAVPADTRKRQAVVAGWCVCAVQSGFSDTISDRCRGTSLCAEAELTVGLKTRRSACCPRLVFDANLTVGLGWTQE